MNFLINDLVSSLNSLKHEVGHIMNEYLDKHREEVFGKPIAINNDNTIIDGKETDFNVLDKYFDTLHKNGVK